MIIDLRYHVFSLAAVFLALGLGIAIGSALPGTDTLLREQEKVITRLEEEFAQLRSERRALEEMVAEKEEELAVMHRFHREILPQWPATFWAAVRWCFQERRDSDEVVEDLGNFLREAGAQSPTLALTTHRWRELALSDWNRAAWAGEFWAELAAELGGNPALLPLMENWPWSGGIFPRRGG